MSCWCEHHEIEGIVGLMTEAAQTRRHQTEVSAIQETDGRIAQERHRERTGTTVDQAGDLAEGDILDLLQAVLDTPIARA